MSAHIVSHPITHGDVSLVITDEIYRPIDAVHIKDQSQFTHQYHILYPVNEVATFEAPVRWVTNAVNESSVGGVVNTKTRAVSITSSVEEDMIDRETKGTSRHTRTRSHVVSTKPVKGSRGCCGGQKTQVHDVTSLSGSVLDGSTSHSSDSGETFVTEQGTHTHGTHTHGTHTRHTSRSHAGTHNGTHAGTYVGSQSTHRTAMKKSKGCCGGGAEPPAESYHVRSHSHGTRTRGSRSEVSHSKHRPTSSHHHSTRSHNNTHHRTSQSHASHTGRNKSFTQY